MGNVDQLFKEYGVTKDEQRKIMDVMDKYRIRISNGENVSYSEYESDIISIFGGNRQAMLRQPAIEYHFCEFVARDFMEDGRWEEVFHALYDKFPKFGGKIE